MHRVELKESIVPGLFRTVTLFLMHRVELKVRKAKLSYRHLNSVPNAPCGVESYL